jgi:polyhydroxyalkanoate synthesis repressor PhaR
MPRLIKRYGSRKLYDTEESRYVLLEDVAAWIRQGQEVRVVDNRTGEDVTAQTLTQIISEEGRRGVAMLPNALLHELIRVGQEAFSGGVEKLQQRVDRVMRASIDRLGPIRKAREEMEMLRERLQDLETSLVEIEGRRPAPAGRAPRRSGRARTAPATGAAGPKDGSARGRKNQVRSSEE